MNIFQQTKYILWELDMPISFKLKYFLEKIIKLPVLLLNWWFWLKLRLPRIIKENYTLKNKDGVWHIKYWSDFDYIINPYFETELRKCFLLEDWIFLDIGTHVWKWSIFVAKQDADNQVYCIEWNPETFKYLNANISSNKLNNIKTYNIAATEVNWPIIFECNTEYQWISKISNSKHISPGKKELIEVQWYRMDNFLEQENILLSKVNLVKIDVEWFEFEVLRWFGEDIKKLNKNVRIICEINWYQENKNDIIAYMEQMWFNAQLLPSNCDYLFTYRY